MKVLSPKRNLIGPSSDFLLLGGASLLLWLLFLISQKFSGFQPIASHMASVPATMVTLALFVNFPHFMASYRIAYSQDRNFLFQNKFELIFVPIILGALFFLASTFIQQKRADYFELLTSVLLDIMFLSVGWHYCKQTFGCMMIAAKFSDYHINASQRKSLLFHIHTIWLFVFIYTHVSPSTFDYYGFNYTSRLVLSKYLLVFWAIAFVGSLAFFLFQVVYVQYKKEGVFPGIQFWVPLLAIYVWWLPFFSVGLFGMHMVPFFHSLQYLVFVRTYEVNSNKVSFPYFMIGLCLIGFLAFEGLPGLLASTIALDQTVVGGFAFFTGFFAIFINIHHYFIDSVIWRLNSPHIRQNLLLEKQ